LPGSGKYLHPITEMQDRAVLFEDLPDTAEEADYGTWDQLIPEKHGLKLEHKIPEGHGWWPVVGLRWNGMHKDFGYQSHQSYFDAVKLGIEPTWGPCKYQIADGSDVISAWPIRITRPSRL
jgi:hypothetical protein